MCGVVKAGVAASRATMLRESRGFKMLFGAVVLNTLEVMSVKRYNKHWPTVNMGEPDLASQRQRQNVVWTGQREEPIDPCPRTQTDE
jgi:hypothetical protein